LTCLAPKEQPWRHEPPDLRFRYSQVLSKDEVIKIRDGSSGWKIALQYAKRDADGNITEINSPWHNYFVEMGKKTAIRRIAKFLPMSVQRAAVVEDLVDSGKKFTADQFGEIVIEADENTIDGSAEHVEERTHGGKLDEFAGKPADQGAGNSSPPEVKPTDPKPTEKPTFNINAHTLTTAQGVKAAAAEFIAVLGAYPQEERGGVFVNSSGETVADAMRAHGLALDVKKIEALGISLPPVEAGETVPGFLGKKGAAA